MHTFDSMLADIVARPALYVGKHSLRAVSDYLAGYAHALTDAGKPDPLAGWFRWVEMRFLISHPAWHWTRILLHVFGSEEAALERLPALYSEFRAFVSEHGIDGIGAEHSGRFLATYGMQYHEPKDTHTSID